MNRIFSVLVVSIFAVGALVNFSVGVPEVKVYWVDIALVVVLILMAGKKMFRAPINIRHPTYTYPFLVICLLSLVFNAPYFGWEFTIVGGLYLVRYCLYTVVWVTLVQILKASHNGPSLGTIGMVITAVGLGQYFLFGDLRLIGGDWDPHYYRLTGSLLDPGFTGILLVFTGIYLNINPPRNGLLNWLGWSGSYLALALTYSRASYAAFAIVAAYLGWRGKSVKFVAAVAVLSVATYLLLPRPGGEGVKLERTSTVVYRVENWKETWAIFRSRPVWGVGFNLLRYARRDAGFLDTDAWRRSHSGAGADSSILFVAATTGLVGLAGYAYFLWGLWRTTDESGLIKPTLIAVGIHSLFLNSLFFPQVLLWLGILVAGATFGTQRQFPSGIGCQTGRKQRRRERFRPR